jgi:hypothetical protein
LYEGNAPGHHVVGKSSGLFRKVARGRTKIMKQIWCKEEYFEHQMISAKVFPLRFSIGTLLRCLLPQTQRMTSEEGRINMIGLLVRGINIIGLLL